MATWCRCRLIDAAGRDYFGPGLFFGRGMRAAPQQGQHLQHRHRAWDLWMKTCYMIEACPVCGLTYFGPAEKPSQDTPPLYRG
eukprot:4657878-Prymnesium_polylepis.1